MTQFYPIFSEAILCSFILSGDPVSQCHELILNGQSYELGQNVISSSSSWDILLIKLVPIDTSIHPSVRQPASQPVSQSINQSLYIFRNAAKE